MVSHIKSHFSMYFARIYYLQRHQIPLLEKKLENFWKSIPAKEIKVKKKRKLWKTAVIHTNVTFNQNVSQHVQIPCLKNQYAKNQIVCLTTSWTIPLRKDKVKISHTKISHNFSRNKNASTEPHNYPINLF